MGGRSGEERKGRVTGEEWQEKEKQIPRLLARDDSVRVVPKWEEYPRSQAVFVSFGFAQDKRVANKGVAACRAWKSVRKMKGWDSREPFGQILSYNNWLAITGTPPPVFHKCHLGPAARETSLKSFRGKIATARSGEGHA